MRAFDMLSENGNLLTYLLTLITPWLLLVNAASVARGLYRSNVGKKTKTFNSGGYMLEDASSGRTTGEFYRAGEDDG